MAIPILGELSLLIMAALIAFLAQPLLDARQCDGSVEAPQPVDASRVLSTVGNALSVSVSAIASRYSLTTAA
jgi:hypothetical protein